MQFMVAGNFTFNEVSLSGGAIYADESSTTVTADQYNHTVNEAAIGNCFVKFPSTLFHQVYMWLQTPKLINSWK